jgi:cytochrome P450
MDMDSAPTAKTLTDLVASDRGHEVQYYEHSQFLVNRVADFLAPGITAGEAVVVIATPKHADLIDHALRARGFDLAAARRDGYFVSLDAVETLKQIMTEDRPDHARFTTVVGGAIEMARSKAKAPIVRAFGEMVAVLWARGRPGAALALEDVWNDLLGHHPLALLCGYPVTGLAEADVEQLTVRHTAAAIEKGSLDPKA